MKALFTAIAAIVMGVCFSAMTMAQASLATLETSPESIVQAKSTGTNSAKKSGKKSRKQQKAKKHKRGNSDPKRSRPKDSPYSIITSQIRPSSST